MAEALAREMNRGLYYVPDRQQAIKCQIEQKPIKNGSQWANANYLEK